MPTRRDTVFAAKHVKLLAQEGCGIRVGIDASTLLQRILEEHARSICSRAVDACHHSARRTVLGSDVTFAVNMTELSLSSRDRKGKLYK